jgi:divalent metal cation (Fe/Co/Zn/Cd) transporter
VTVLDTADQRRSLIRRGLLLEACWYLSVVTLAGLLLNALLGWWWADPLAALAIAVLLVREGIEAVRGADVEPR